MTIHATAHNDGEVPPEYVPCWPWCRNSCALDALLTCSLALACQLRKYFFHAAGLGNHIIRQIGVELREIMGDSRHWSKISFHLLTCLRDNVRNYLLDPCFVYPPVDVNSKSALDILDKYLIPRDLIDWFVVRRRVCDACGHDEPNGTFAKDMRGLWLKINPGTSRAFGSIQNIVDNVVS